MIAKHCEKNPPLSRASAQNAGRLISVSAAQADALGFAGKWGGKVLRHAEVRPGMADLGGGSQQDTKM